MEYHSFEDRAQRMQERAMELVFIQVDSVRDEIEQLALFIDEIEDIELREKLGKHCISAMSYLDKI